MVRIDESEIELLPDRCVALLKEEKSQPKFYFVEKREADYLYSNDKKKLEISKSSLKSRWNQVVLLVEKSVTGDDSSVKKNNLAWVLPSLCLVLFLSILFLFAEKAITKLFFIFPIIRILFSIAALKDLFGNKLDQSDIHACTL